LNAAIDADDLVAERAECLRERVADRGRADVVIREVLGDVRRAEVDADRLARTDVAREQGAAQRGVHDQSKRGRPVEREVDVGTRGRRTREQLGRLKGGHDLFRDLGGLAALGLRDRKTAHGEIAELRALGHLDLEAPRLDTSGLCDDVGRCLLQWRVMTRHRAAQASTERSTDSRRLV
jgi:hypothetical protein